MPDKPSKLRRTLISSLALMLAVASIGGAVTLGASPSYSGPLDDQMNEVSPVGEGRALAVTATGIAIGVTAVAATAKTACDKEILICKDDAPTAEQMAKADALETKTEIHGEAASSRQYQDNFFQQFDNDATGMKTIARTEGKQAYVRSLENGSSEAIARSEARQAVADYFSTRQKMLASQWETVLVQGENMAATAQNTSNMSESFTKQLTYTEYGPDESKIYDFNYVEGTQAVPLVNGSSTQVISYGASAARVRSGGDPFWPWKNYTATLADSPDIYPQPDENPDVHVKFNHVSVQPPNDNFQSVEYLNFSSFHQRWNTLQQYNTEVQNNLDDFINLTYSQWDAGKIDSSDLVDPYLGAREYDPQNSSSWALRSAMAMGINPPNSTGSIANMTIQTESGNLTGLLMTPGDFTFETGTSYDASNQTGTQYVFDPDTGEMTKISGNYSILEIRGTDGSTQTTIEYQDTQAGATNLTEFKQRMERNQDLLAEIEARQKALRDQLNNGGVGPLEGILGGSVPGIAIIAAAGAALLLLRN